jgi:hypothetical protein
MLTLQNACQCSICFERDADTQLQPCGHMMCEVCFQSVRKGSIFSTRSGFSCPFCRSVVQSHRSQAGPQGAMPSAASVWPSANAGQGLQQDPLNFSDMNQGGGHQWFCGVAAQVARAELEAARMAGVSEGGLNGRTPVGDFVRDQRSALEAQQLQQARYHRETQHADAHHVHQEYRSHTHAQGNEQGLAHALMQGGGVAGRQPAFANGAVPWRGEHDAQANLAAAAMHAQHRASVMAAMRQPGATGMGNVDYMNLAGSNRGGPQVGWMGGGDGKSHEDLMHHAMFAGGDAGEEDGSSNILKMMFGVAL